MGNPGAMQVPLTELFKRHGKPNSRGVRVMFSPSHGPSHRSAYILWKCEDFGPDVCPVNCIAYNSLPYENVAYSIEEFPQDKWLITPRPKHTPLLVDFPAGNGASDLNS